MVNILRAEILLKSTGESMGYKYAIIGSGKQGTASAYDFIEFGDAEKIILFDKDIRKDKPDIEDVESFRRVEYNGKQYIMIRNNVYENKTTFQLRQGDEPKLIGHAEIDLEGNITNIQVQSIEAFTPVIINGRKLLKKGNTIYSFLSSMDIEKGLKPIRLFEEK